MSKADNVYTDMLRHILANGSVTKDGSDEALRSFGIVNRYDLREEFPLLTIGKVNLKQGIDEILWIYQKKTPYVTSLTCEDSIYHTFASITNSVGKTLGYQIGKKFTVREKRYRPREILERQEEFYNPDVISRTENFIRQVEDNPENFDYRVMVRTTCDQMDMVLHHLKYEPYNDKIILNLFDHIDLIEMNVIPDIYSCIFTVTNDKSGRQVLNMVINQRTLDAYNCTGHIIAKYAAFLMMIAREVCMIPGEIIHMIADAHIHFNDIPAIENLLSNYSIFSAAEVILNPEEKNFYKMHRDSFSIFNYRYGDLLFKNTLKEVRK